MFADSLSSLSSQIFSSTAVGISKVVEDPGVKSLLEKHTKEVLVQAMSSRSPFLQEIGKSILDLMKEKEDSKNSISSLLDKNKDFKEAASVSLGEQDISKITDSLLMIFRSIEKSNDKETEQYKLFGKLYEEYKTNSSKEKQTHTKTFGTRELDTLISQAKEFSSDKITTNNNSTDTLSKIETNTNLTVEKLESLSSSIKDRTYEKRETAPSDNKNSDPINKDNKKNNNKTPVSFIQNVRDDLKNNLKDSYKNNLITPGGVKNMAGGFLMSVANSVVTRADEKVKETISKQFTKFFDKDVYKTTEKSKEKLKEYDSKTNESEKETNREKVKIEEKQSSMLESMLVELRKINSSDKKSTSSSSILDTVKNSIFGSAVGKVGSIVKGGLGKVLGGAAAVARYLPAAASSVGSNILNAARMTTVSAKELGSKALPQIATKAASIGSSVAGATRTALSAATPFALPALALSGAVTAGYQLGDKIINPLLNKGISAVTGKDSSVGSLFADMFKSDAEKQLEAENKRYADKQKNISNAKVSSVQTITETSDKVQAALNKKEQITSSASKQPIVIQQNSTNNQSSNSTPQIIGQKVVRNTESTFERVQMQDYWSRSY